MPKLPLFRPLRETNLRERSRPSQCTPGPKTASACSPRPLAVTPFPAPDPPAPNPRGPPPKSTSRAILAEIQDYEALTFLRGAPCALRNASIRGSLTPHTAGR